MTAKALIIVDVQCDFCEGGTLEVRNSQSLVNQLQVYIDRARRNGLLIVFTQDWHPLDHSSFKFSGGEWPVHCVAESSGAELMSPLAAEADDLMIRKGMNSGSSGYSAFEFTDLADQLRRHKIDSVAICGIATEYCVSATALDAINAGWKTVLLIDLIRAVHQERADVVLKELTDVGVSLASSEIWLE